MAGELRRKKMSHLSQTAVDSFFDYLYYLSQTPETEMFASAIPTASKGGLKVISVMLFATPGS
jgi:hypothetical protein